MTVTKDTLYFLEVQQAAMGREVEITCEWSGLTVLGLSFRNHSWAKWWYLTNKTLPCMLSKDPLKITIGSYLPVVYSMSSGTTNFDTLTFISLYFRNEIMEINKNVHVKFGLPAVFPEHTIFYNIRGQRIYYNPLLSNNKKHDVVPAIYFSGGKKTLKMKDGLIYYSHE
jgi:hypothetical protein